MSAATVGAGTRVGQEQPDELWTAVEIARGVRTRLISSCDAVESCLRRIERTNPAVNALAEVSAAEALARADEAGRLSPRRRTGGDRRPTSARTSTGTPAAARWCGGCRPSWRTAAEVVEARCGPLTPVEPR